MPASRTVVLVFGRFNPPTTGHGALINFVNQIAQRNSADVRVYPSQTQDPRRNPLPFRNKVAFLRKFFPKLFVSDNVSIRTPVDAFQEVSSLGYRKILMVVGSDRVRDFQKFAQYLVPRKSPKYNVAKHIDIDQFQVIAVPGNRDPDADDVTGMSAGKMRATARANDFKAFGAGIPPHVPQKVAKDLFKQVRQHMGLREMFNLSEGQFNIGMFKSPSTQAEELTEIREFSTSTKKFGWSLRNLKPGTRVKISGFDRARARGATGGDLAKGRVVSYHPARGLAPRPNRPAASSGPYAGDAYYIVDFGASGKDKVSADKVIVAGESDVKEGKSVSAASQRAYNKAIERLIDKHDTLRVNPLSVAQRGKILNPGTWVKITGSPSRSGRGKVVRYDKGDRHGSPFYIIDVGKYESEKIPAHNVVKEEATQSFTEEVFSRGQWVKIATGSPSHSEMGKVISYHHVTPNARDAYYTIDTGRARSEKIQARNVHRMAPPRFHGGWTAMRPPPEFGSAERVGSNLFAVVTEARRGPLKGHPYHTKSDAELRYIAKDASEAAKAMRGHSPKAELKYLDQVNDVATVLYHRKHGGKQVKEATKPAGWHLPVVKGRRVNASPLDQKRAAGIIFTALGGGREPVGKTTPSKVVDIAIVAFMRGRHTPEGWRLAGQMLNKATELGIKWNQKLIKPTTRQAMKMDEASKIKLPPHLAKFFDRDGNLTKDAADRVAKGKAKFNVKDVTPKGYGITEAQPWDHFKVGDKVHAGMRHRGGVGFDGKVERIEGNWIYVNLGPEPGSKWGDRIIKAPRKYVMAEKDDQWVKEAATPPAVTKPPTETEKLRSTQQQELIALKTRQTNTMMAAKLRDVQQKAREQQAKANQPKSAASPASS